MPANQLIEKPSPRVDEVSLAIGGMTCGSCAARVQDRLNAMDGVQATVNYATERARVTLPELLSPDRLVEEVRAAGFTAQVLGARSIRPTSAPRQTAVCATTAGGWSSPAS